MSQDSSYKIEFFKNPYAYFFMLSIISMQLVEFFLWRNLKNKKANTFFSTVGLLLIFIQPFASLLLITNIPLRNKLLWLYSVPAVIGYSYILLNANIHTVVSSCGHLKWNWAYHKSFGIDIICNIFYLFFLFFSLVYNGHYAALTLILIYFLILYYFYRNGTFGSIWCLSANALMIYFLVKILIVIPFNEMVVGFCR
jgi:hypothetical protein